MNEMTAVRENRGGVKLSKTAICCHCHKPIAKVRKYRIRTVSLPGSGSLAFYYSHLRCRRI